MEIIYRFDEDGITCNRESVFCEGMWWHRYPKIKYNKGRCYFHKTINKKIKCLHIFIYEKYIGERTKGHHVHHIDENTSNNDPSNLILISHSDHSKIHSIGNTNFLGKHHTEEAKQKISNSNKGNTNFLGKKHSEETKALMSLVQMGNKNNLGKNLSIETKNKISIAHIGKTHSDETKAKMSDSAKNRWNKNK